MSADAVSMGTYPTHTATFNQIESRLDDLQKVLETHGTHQVAAAVHNEFVTSLVENIREMIRNSDEPQFKKDQYMEFLDDSLGSLKHPVSSETEEAVKNSPLGEKASEAGGSAGFSHGDEDGAVSTNQMEKGGPEKSSKAKSGGGNWLLALAKGLAEIQDKFLGIALESLKVMEDNADAMSEPASGSGSTDGNSGGDSEGGDRGAFLVAQAKYQASMQMFNMMANMTATSLKSLGEGLTAIARKQ